MLCVAAKPEVKDGKDSKDKPKDEAKAAVVPVLDAPAAPGGPAPFAGWFFIFLAVIFWVFSREGVLKQ